MSSSMMDTAAGGEGDGYENVKTGTTDLPEKSSGQMSDSSSEQTNVDSVKEEQGEKKAEGIRYGQNVSESGMGGMTNTSTGDANQGGYGKTEEQSGQDTDMSMRREQGYGGGSGVGA